MIKRKSIKKKSILKKSIRKYNKTYKKLRKTKRKIKKNIKRKRGGVFCKPVYFERVLLKKNPKNQDELDGIEFELDENGIPKTELTDFHEITTGEDKEEYLRALIGENQLKTGQKPKRKPKQIINKGATLFVWLFKNFDKSEHEQCDVLSGLQLSDIRDFLKLLRDPINIDQKNGYKNLKKQAEKFSIQSPFIKQFNLYLSKKFGIENFLENCLQLDKIVKKLLKEIFRKRNFEIYKDFFEDFDKLSDEMKKKNPAPEVIKLDTVLNEFSKLESLTDDKFKIIIILLDLLILLCDDKLDEATLIKQYNEIVDRQKDDDGPLDKLGDFFEGLSKKFSRFSVFSGGSMGSLMRLGCDGSGIPCRPFNIPGKGAITNESDGVGVNLFGGLIELVFFIAGNLFSLVVFKFVGEWIIGRFVFGVIIGHICLRFFLWNIIIATLFGTILANALLLVPNALGLVFIDLVGKEVLEIGEGFDWMFGTFGYLDDENTGTVSVF